MTNRLADSPSLYLRKHAENPIDWWPWCDEALERARADNKPIFLSIGYSSCHWCTVMEGEAFSDEAIAAYMNANFIPIKVDREERPDIDSIYMQALQMLTGQGGWPLNVMLHPETRVPFYGGTYFPLEQKYGRPGFLQVLTALRQFYDTEKSRLAEITEAVMGNLHQGAQLPETPAIPSADVLYAGLTTNAKILIPSGQGTCFPMIPYAAAVLGGLRFDLELDVAHLCGQRGRDMALGGIYDHVGGGFHRYTVDPSWTVPHFEKMLYDNGMIVEYLADLWASGQQEPAFERAIALTHTWLLREMTAPDGYFYAAQDADSFVTSNDAEPEEGAFYAWPYKTLESALTTDQMQALANAFAVTLEGNFEGQIVLQRFDLGSLSAEVELALGRLFTLRYGTPAAELETFLPAIDNQAAKTQPWPGRIPPVTDTKLIVAWNSLMISGLAKAAIAFHNPDYLATAITAAEYIRHHQWVGSQLHRLGYDGTPQVSAQSEDYALLIKAFLDLHQANLALANATAATNWLTLAISTQHEFDHHLWSADQGGYMSAASGKDLLVQERPYQDSATPAANGVAVANLVRLSLLTDNLDYLDRADRTLQAFGTVMEQIPRACPSLLTGLNWFRNGTVVKAVADIIPELAAEYWPTTVFTVSNDLSDDAVGMVCRGTTCLAVADSADKLRQQLQTLRPR
ncbi:thioredoxin domain-containing protein [Leptolyngbya sp. CCNP1308]|uniref:thioredoxin domain-containing protein n=1 Tax=Leptolyngbya sp. CCNP1308 TaxID=3110255 RepID=UPI002B1F7F8C|nr:thioredoxin domain-containing protein [Leptolyngbya sp. CCNP1308]MEA5448176.1 thioredoxin domain-containing protein [Leptolyngbya sp. CCNP1308]